MPKRYNYYGKCNKDSQIFSRHALKISQVIKLGCHPYWKLHYDLLNFKAVFDQTYVGCFQYESSWQTGKSLIWLRFINHLGSITFVQKIYLNLFDLT